MSTRGHSTIDRIVSATLEERRERYRSSSVPFASSLAFLSYRPSSPRYFLARYRLLLLSRSFFETLYRLFPLLSFPWMNLTGGMHRAALPSTFLVRFVDDHWLRSFSSVLKFLLSASYDTSLYREILEPV